MISIIDHPRLNYYWQLFRFDRPIGTYLLLWPTLWALWLASSGQPPAHTLMIFIIGVIVMRAAGSAVNDIIDRNIDPHVSRTKNRPLANKSLTTVEAILLTSILLSIALILFFQLNTHTQLLALCGALLTLMYPLSKRYFPCPQAVLGVTWSFGILMAFMEVQHKITVLAVVLYLTHLLLTIAYDTIYAFCDRDDDKKIGVNSAALWFGTYDKRIVGVLHVIVFALFLFVGYYSKLNIYYYLFLSIALLTVIYQHWLIRDYDRDACLTAFKMNHYTGLWVFVGIFFGLLK